MKKRVAKYNIGLLKSLPDIKFLSYSKFYFMFSLVLCLLFVIFSVVKDYNFGIDFAGGSSILIDNSDHEAINDIKLNLVSMDIPVASVRTVDVTSVELFINSDRIDNKVMQDYIDVIKKNFPSYKILQVQFVGPSISSELIYNSIIALLLSFIAIWLYLYFRYDWQYGIIGIIALVHDVVVALLAVNIMGYAIELSTVAACLLIIGYSINDTVVLFDQVRENVSKYTQLSYKDILNKSINQVLSRSIATSLTVILVLLAIYLFAGDSLKSFSFTLLVGVLVGAYSSIFLATPLLAYIGNIKRKLIANNN